MNTNFNQLDKDVRSAVNLFSEFGSRNKFVWKGQTIFENDVTEPEKEGIFISRCVRNVAKREGAEKAYQTALKMFSDNVYNRMQVRNKTHETPRQQTLSDMRLFGANTLIKIREAQKA